MAYADVVLADSPVGYWKLNEASGLPQDSSGNGLHVTVVTGTPIYGVSGPISGDTAMEFDGSTEGLSIPDNNLLDLGNIVSLEAWVQRLSTNTDDVFIDKGVGAYTMYAASDGTLRLHKSMTASIVSSTYRVVDIGGYDHYVVTKNGAVCDIYVNGGNCT